MLLFSTNVRRPESLAAENTVAKMEVLLQRAPAAPKSKHEVDEVVS